MVSCYKPSKRPKYPLYTGFELRKIVPDSNKAKMAEWITKTVSATNFHMKGGDYEDPEEVIEQAEETAENIFSVEVPCLLIRTDIDQSVLKYPNELNKTETKALDSLRAL